MINKYLTLNKRWLQCSMILSLRNQFHMCELIVEWKTLQLNFQEMVLMAREVPFLMKIQGEHFGTQIHCIDSLERDRMNSSLKIQCLGKQNTSDSGSIDKIILFPQFCKLQPPEINSIVKTYDFILLLRQFSLVKSANRTNAYSKYHLFKSLIPHQQVDSHLNSLNKAILIEDIQSAKQIFLKNYKQVYEKFPKSPLNRSALSNSRFNNVSTTKFTLKENENQLQRLCRLEFELYQCSQKQQKEQAACEFNLLCQKYIRQVAVRRVLFEIKKWMQFYQRRKTNLAKRYFCLWNIWSNEHIVKNLETQLVDQKYCQVSYHKNLLEKAFRSFQLFRKSRK